jgi:hypothetical protein
MILEQNLTSDMAIFYHIPIVLYIFFYNYNTFLAHKALQERMLSDGSEPRDYLSLVKTLRLKYTKLN